MSSDTIHEEECEDSINSDVLERVTQQMAKLDIDFITNTPKAHRDQEQ